MDKKLLEFLITAKKATYAGKGAETTSSRIKSHDLIYEDGDYMYYDTYLGTKKFAGEAAIWIKDVPYWSMYVDTNRLLSIPDKAYSTIFGPFLVQRRIPTGGLSPSCISFSLLVKTISI